MPSFDPQLSTSTGRAEAEQPGMSDSELRLREALVLWVRWNEAYERAAGQLFSAGGDPAQVEAFMDQIDELRRRAVELSHELLDG